MMMLMCVAALIVLIAAMKLMQFPAAALIDMPERISVFLPRENSELPRQAEACIRSGLAFRVGRAVCPLPVRAYTGRCPLAL